MRSNLFGYCIHETANDSLRRKEFFQMFKSLWDLRVKSNILRRLEHRAGIEPANTGFADQRVSHFATGARGCSGL